MPLRLPIHKLGKKPFKYNPRTFRLADYRSPSLLPPIPVHKDWTRGRVHTWGEMGNDKAGDCTIAAAGHAILGWTTDAGKGVIVPDVQIFNAYSAVTGMEGAAYDPATGANDNGCNMQDVLSYWRNVGIGGHKISAYMALENGNLDHVKETLLVFGSVYIGLALPISAQGAPSWTVAGPLWSPSCQPGSWGGHCVIVVEYDANGLTVITWGQLLRMSWPFYGAYCDEAYAILSPDFLTGGRSPAGINLTDLQTDLSQL